MFILDVKGFQYKDEGFICKEIAIIHLKSGVVFHRLINLPHPLNWFCYDVGKNFELLQQHSHGLSWNDHHPTKFIAYESISLFIKKIVQNERIFVLDSHKKAWLNSLICNEIINFSEKFYVNLETLRMNNRKKYICNNHFINNSVRYIPCARENVFLLRNWYKKYHLDCTYNY